MDSFPKVNNRIVGQMNTECSAPILGDSSISIYTEVTLGYFSIILAALQSRWLLPQKFLLVKKHKSIGAVFIKLFNSSEVVNLSMLILLNIL